MDDKLKEYEKLESELKISLQEKKQQEEEFDRIQQEIYDKETEYLSGNNSSSNINIGGNKSTYGGNIIKGFEGFIKTHHHGHDANHGFTNDDRIFSLSSAIFVKQQQQLDDLQDQE